MVLANTLGEHKPSRRYTWHAPNGRTRTQIDYIMVQYHYKSGFCRAKTRTFPGADIGSDHDLVMMKAKNTRLKFNLDKLKDPNISSLFEARIGGTFGPLLLLEGDAEAIANNFNEVMTEVATDTLDFSCPKTQAWATDDILNMCDTRRLLKPQRKTPRGKIEYRKVNKHIKKGMKEARQKWIDDQCEEIEHSIATNNTKKAFRLVKTLTKQQQSKANNTQDKDGKGLTEGEDDEKMDRVLLRTVHISEQRRPKCTNLSRTNGGRGIPNPQTISGIGHQNIKMRKGNWS